MQIELNIEKSLKDTHVAKLMKIDFILLNTYLQKKRKKMAMLQKIIKICYRLLHDISILFSIFLIKKDIIFTKNSLIM